MTDQTAFFRKGWLRNLLRSPFFNEALPLSESDYPFHGDWYKRFENKVASIVPLSWTPNYLTFFRFMVSALLIAVGSTLPSLVIFIIAVLGGLTDFFDGVIARSRNQKTRFGVTFDPIADKLLMLAILCVLVFQNTINLSLVLLMVLAETHLIIAPILSFVYQLLKNGSQRSFRITEKRIRPSLLGKIKMLFYVCGFLILIVSHMIDSKALRTIGVQVLMAGIATAFLALAQYVFRWIREPS